MAAVFWRRIEIVVLLLVVVPTRSSSYFEYIAFGKTGSTTLRAILGERARRKGWQRFLARGQNQICHYRRPGDCGKVPPGYVVQTSDVQAMQFCKRRPSCRAFTLMREVVSRMVSDWEYFCLSCREGKKCTGLRPRHLPRDQFGVPTVAPSLTCPNMSLVDYAAHSGNVYTYTFCENPRPPHVFGVNESHFRSALRSAVEALVAGRLTVLFTEELSKTSALPDLFKSLFGERLPTLVPRKNANKHYDAKSSQHLSCATRTALLRILKWDALLYAHLRLFSRKPDLPPPACSPSSSSS